jgi:hypothetical protein
MITIIGYIALIGIGIYILMLGITSMRLTIGFGGGTTDRIISAILILIAIVIFFYLFRHVKISFISD